MLQFAQLQVFSAQADARECNHSHTRACCSWALRLADSSAANALTTHNTKVNAKASTSRINVTQDKSECKGVTVTHVKSRCKVTDDTSTKTRACVVRACVVRAQPSMRACRTRCSARVTLSSSATSSLSPATPTSRDTRSVTRHASRVTRHTSRVTRHAPRPRLSPSWLSPLPNSRSRSDVTAPSC